MAGLVCWRCGASLKDIPMPFNRLAQCKACAADLHVCRLCKFYNPQHFEKCDHEMAEPAREVDVANFCHYFRPASDAYHAEEKSRADAALAQLKALFGDSSTEAKDKPADRSDEDKDTDARSKFDALFKKD